jgi:hypothetical protein
MNPKLIITSVIIAKGNVTAEGATETVIVTFALVIVVALKVGGEEVEMISRTSLIILQE